MIYRADSIHLDLIDLARRHALVDTHGAPTFSDCAQSTTMLPVVFTSEQSVIELTDVWRRSGPSTTSVQFQMTTNEQDSLIMYSVGEPGTSHFFGVELVQGLLLTVTTHSMYTPPTTGGERHMLSGLPPSRQSVRCSSVC